MANRNLFYYVIVVCLSVLKSDCAFLNVEELQDLRYAVDMLTKPVNSDKINFSEGLQLASKHGQDYYCRLPTKALEMADHPLNEDRLPADYPISKLLDPLTEEPCLKTVVGWWTYEFCYNKFLQQYHSEDGSVLGTIKCLGMYGEDFDWNNEEKLREKLFKRKQIQKYHTQYYVNGTKCDVIPHNRDAEIRYYCDETATTSYIERVDEPSTCSYIVTIRTNLICSHPHTRLMMKSKPVDVICNPMLSPNNYQRYLDQQARTAAEAFDKANVLLREKRNRLKELLLELKTQVAAENSQPKDSSTTETKYTSEVDLLLDVLDEKTDPSNDKTRKQGKINDAEELAIDFIQRFVDEEKIFDFSAQVRRELFRFTKRIIDRFNFLPSADLARLVRFEIENFLERQESMSANFFNKLMQGIDAKKTTDGAVKVTSQGPVQIKVRHERSGMVHEDDSSLQNPAIKQLEEEIERELQNVGITAKKIEVHLVTSNKRNGEELTEIETFHFKEALLELMGGGSIEEREKRKFNRMLDTYNMLYEDNKADFVLRKEDDQEEKVTRKL